MSPNMYTDVRKEQGDRSIIVKFTCRIIYGCTPFYICPAGYTYKIKGDLHKSQNLKYTYFQRSFYDIRSREIYNKKVE